jgi:hypothetical protein
MASSAARRIEDRAQRAPEPRTAALLGRAPIDGDGGRIRLCSGARAVELLVHEGHWGCFGLPAGTYRVEYVERRRILAREVDVAEGCEVEIDFDVW